MPALHAISPHHTADDLGVRLSWCGIPGSRLVQHADLEGRADACKLCLRIIAKRRSSEPRPIRWDEALTEMARLIAGPPVPPMPALTPELWASMDCKRGTLIEEGDVVSLHPHRLTPAAWRELGCPTRVMRCRCEVCQAEEQATPAMIAWSEEQQLRPHRKYEYQFGSLNAALELLARWRIDGPTTRSSHGSAQARAEESARLGTQVQTTLRTDRDSLETRRAIYVADIEHALRRAYAQEGDRRGLTLDLCMSIVLSVASTRGLSVAAWAEQTGLSARAIRSLVSHGRRAMTVELVVGEYLPMPRDRAGLHRAIYERQREIEERGVVA